ncbi:unnamed protein product [Wuchereria bancrofti]|uniref:HTH CENPB-type domain-containing protein n=1 Tax=Wuchereria bancrofti TaxID=6293 RepID=A0A3P7G9X2_WUCBA|nr:unnamed protein product [Wuchereria bancrofti]
MDLTKYSPMNVQQQQQRHHQPQPCLDLQMPNLTSAETSQASRNISINNCSMLPPASVVVPLPSTSTATIKSLVPEGSQLSPEKSSASSLLAQLLTSPKTTVLHRPTPIHPIASRLFTLTTKTPTLETSLEVPLDLSQSTAARQQSLIKTQQQQQSKFLPTCANPNLNSNWIAIKLGAAVGPNRMSYPREFKLMVINYYYTNGQNKYRTCKEFQITKSMLNGWLQKIDKIRQSRPGSLKSGRSEQELAGMCQFSERWLSNFKKRYRINLNRDWSSGNSSSGSLGSTESVGSGSSVADSMQQSPTKSDETAENESIDSDADSVLSDSLETLIDVEDQINSDNSLAIFTSGTFPTAEEHVQEILNKPGQLPIQAFYERFPWLCRKNQTGAEPGRRGRKVQFPGVEKVLFEKLQEQQSKGERVSNRWLQQQARELALQICPEVLQEATKSARCLFSEHWLHNFKKRYGVTLKQTNRNVISSSKTSEIILSTTASQCDSSLTGDKNSTSSTNGTAVKPVTDLTTMLQLQNWFLAKYYSQEQGTNAQLAALPQSSHRNTTVPSSSASVWHPTPLTQCLL